MTAIALRSMAATALLATALGCMPNQITPDPVSNCNGSADQNWLNLGLKIHHYEPKYCPVPTTNVAVTGQTPKPIPYVANIWDEGYKMPVGEMAITTFKNATGGAVDQAVGFFTFYNVGQPGNMMAAHIEGSYPPGWVGQFGSFPMVDTAVTSVPVPQSSAYALGKVNLPYRFEGTTYLTGPTSVTYGDLVQMNNRFDELRRPTQVTWKVDGQVQMSGSLPFTQYGQTFNPVFSSSGYHSVSVTTVSDLGKTVTQSQYVHVALPTGCGGGGGGGAELNSCPPQ